MFNPNGFEFWRLFKTVLFEMFSFWIIELLLKIIFPLGGTPFDLLYAIKVLFVKLVVTSWKRSPFKKIDTPFFILIAS